MAMGQQHYVKMIPRQHCTTTLLSNYVYASIANAPDAHYDVCSPSEYANLEATSSHRTHYHIDQASDSGLQVEEYSAKTTVIVSGKIVMLL